MPSVFKPALWKRCIRWSHPCLVLTQPYRAPWTCVQAAGCKCLEWFFVFFFARKACNNQKHIRLVHTHLNVRGGFRLEIWGFWLADVRRNIEARNCFKAHRLHPWFKASACSDTVAKLILLTERYHWLSELRLRHVWQIKEHRGVLWETSKMCKQRNP